MKRYLIAAAACGLVALGLVPLAACSGASGVATTIADDAIDCAKADLGQTVTEVGLTILADVALVIEAGDAGWQTALDTLAKKYGSDAVSCAAKDVLSALEHAQGSASGVSTSAMQRAQVYLTGKRFK